MRTSTSGRGDHRSRRWSRAPHEALSRLNADAAVTRPAAATGTSGRALGDEGPGLLRETVAAWRARASVRQSIERLGVFPLGSVPAAPAVGAIRGRPAGSTGVTTPQSAVPRTVNAAVNQMDRVTQHNAVAVGDSTAAVPTPRGWGEV